VEIRLLGRPAILDDAGAPQPVRGHQTWALLARIVLTERPVSRRTLAGELFASAVDPLGALRWCLAGLRRAMGSPDAFCGDPVEPHLPGGTRMDVHELQAGRFDVDWVGELLEGVDPRCGPEFDTWLLVQRQRVAGLLDGELRAAVLRELSAGDPGRAVELATLGVQRAPFDERAHVLLVKSLVADGAHAAAVAHIEETEKLFRRELDVDPTPALRSAARRRAAEPPAGVSPRAVTASLLESGRAALAAGATDAALECLRRAVDEADGASDAHLHATCLLELGTALVHAVRSYDDEGALLLQQSADLAEQIGAPAIGAEAWRELGYVDALAGRRPTARAHLQRARALADGDDRLLAGILAVDAFNHADWGHHDEALVEYDEAVELARRTGNTRREAWALGLGGWAHLDAGDPSGARSWIDDCLRVTVDARWVAFKPFPMAVAGELRLRDGPAPALLRRELDETFALSCRLADPCWEGAAARTIALAAAAEGDLDSALAWIARARDSCLRETDVFVAMHAAILATEAELAAAAGDAERAETSARTLVALAAHTHMDTHLARGLALLTILGSGTPIEGAR
jgi:DNA-binding SARP family transcriptional activator